MNRRHDNAVYFVTHIACSDVSLTVHLSIILANDQLDAQFFLIPLLQSSTCLEQHLAHLQGVKLY